MSVVLESLLKHHFGEEVMDAVFEVHYFLCRNMYCSVEL